MIKNYDSELKQIKDLASHTGSGQSRFEFELRDNADHLFHALTKDREGIIRFSDACFAMTDNPRAKLDELFGYDVRRYFAGSIYREGLLEKQVRSLLKLREIGRNFKPMTFSDGVYSAKFPFVEVIEDKSFKVLKPLYLGQDDPTRILDHGNRWLFSINRLKDKLPPGVFFTVEGPDDSAKRAQAFREALDLFRASDITVVDAGNETELIEAVER